MISIEKTEKILDKIADELPKDFYRDLNGGIILLPEVKLHPKNKSNDLYILGEYHNSVNMGRYITIYYGSFEHVYGHLPQDQFYEKLKKTLLHEFTHHLEFLAGERGLERKDARDLARYLNS